MRFTDTRGAIAVAVLPALAVPTLLATGLVRRGGGAFLALSFFNTMFLVGAHFGIHSIAGIFYPSAYRANGAGWATSIAKVGSILGPLVGGMALSSGMPVKVMYAFLAACPLVVCIGIFIIGRIQQRTLQQNSVHVWAEPVQPRAAQTSTRD